MPHDIGTGQEIEAYAKNNASPWIWLFEVEVGSSEVAHLTPYDAQVTWNGDTYYPYPMSVPTVPEGKATAQSQAQITVYQVDQMLTDRLRDRELVGNKIRVRLVHADNLSETDVIAHEMTILGASIVRDQRAVTFSVGTYNWLNKQPGRRFVRLRCHHVYGSDACGYDKDRSGALSTCERTYADCLTHGQDEASVGLFQYHPARFGGFPGMPRQNRG